MSRTPLLAAVALAAALRPTPAAAHGIWGHIHVTGWAVENMPDDELRRFLLSDPEVFNALLFGAVFADTGYGLDDEASRAYSEHAHWEPFVEDYVQWVRDNDPPPWDDLESKKRVAFLLGCASHGLQDTLFDSLFLHQVEERDGAGQDVTDPGTDGFLALDGHIRFIPEQHVPMEAVLALTDHVHEDIDADLIQRAVDLVTGAYINGEGGLAVAELLGERYADAMPWGRAHYLDQDVPGSLRAEIFPTMRYQQALWQRLHDGLPVEELVTFAYPEEPRRLRSGDPATVDAWVSLTVGKGVVFDSATLRLLDEAGAPVAATTAANRWGSDPTRLLRVMPTEPLAPGGWYTLRLEAGAETLDGQTTGAPWSHTFQVACETDDDPACPDLGALPEAHIDGLPDAPAGDTGGGAPPAAGGCGCATGAGPAPGAALLLAGLVFVRGRRAGDPDADRLARRP